MDTTTNRFKDKLRKLCLEWAQLGLPSRKKLELTADAFISWKKDHNIKSLWNIEPLMLTATLDDGLGQGLQIIHRYAEVLGVRILSLGLLQKPETILAACRQYKPEFLGMTLLQLDSDEALCQIGHGIHSKTRLIVGGPVFKFDPELAERCKVDFVAKDVSHFIDYLLKWRF